MAAPYSSLQAKTASALKLECEQVSLSNRGSAEVVVGLAGDVELDVPMIVCTAESGEVFIHGTGLRWMDCKVEVYSSANITTTTAHESRYAYIADRFLGTDEESVAANLSAHVSDFNCQAVIDMQETPQRKEDRHIISGFRFKALCGSADLS